MRTRTLLVLTSSALGGLLWMPGPSAALQHQHSQPAHAAQQATAPEPPEQELKVGKKGDVDFRVETIVGELRLKPGRYQFQHRVEGDDHFVHFTEVTKGHPGSVGSGGAPKAHPGEVKCRVEPLGKKVNATTLYTVQEGAARRIQRVLVDGENVAHVF